MSVNSNIPVFGSPPPEPRKKELPAENSENSTIIEKQELPFNPAISQGKENVTITSSESLVKSQEKTIEATEVMVKSAEHLIHESVEKLDNNYICSEKAYKDFLPLIDAFQNLISEFNITDFVSGEKEQNKRNEEIFKASIGIMRAKAIELVSKGEAKDLNTAYKKLVGIIDQYDVQSIKEWKESKFPPKSSYILRTVILKASHTDGVGLHTWNVYTKSGKPEGAEVWGFLEKGKNWIPEAQGLRAKWIESTSVKTKNLSTKFRENRVVLLKGGFGAGKTRYILENFGKYGVGAIAPDKAKEIDRRINPDVPHFAAQAHGSQASYEFVGEMIEKGKGTIIYDSSLYSDEDVTKYLAKCKAAGKKMVIYDMARNDKARILSVLKRSVEGEDPRIPPDLIIASAIRDKLKRVACMQVVLNDDTKQGLSEDLRPEYHFISGDAQGWNAEEVMVLGPEGKIELKPGLEDRLGLEGIEFGGAKLRSTLDEESLKTFYGEMFEKPVQEIMASLSKDEQSGLGVFKSRFFPLPTGNKIDNPSMLYAALPQNIREAISETAFKNSFGLVKDEVQKEFFTHIQLKNGFSYEDLPLRVALAIHQNLTKDPWV